MLKMVMGLLAALLAFGAAAQQPDRPLNRPRVGLVLSGGGARGLAHIGVLKVLEREHVPVDVIAGTSMGAIVGGLYASGMKADEIERELKRIDWNRLFAPRVSRQQLSQRRKEEDFEIASAIELGIDVDGEFRAPQGAVSSRGLETLLRRFTLPVRAVQKFDQLPIPFRAVATDMETGDAVVLGDGDLAMALRSSMSVPGVFPPTEVGGRVLGDGGLINNVPVDVARAMGADVVIAVSIGTPLAPRETLNSAIGLTAQMINILTEQNVKRSLASLTAGHDVLIAPDLGSLSSSDFDRAADFIQLGEQGAERQQAQLAGLALPGPAYAAWRAERHGGEVPNPKLAFVAFEGTTITNPARFEAQLKSQPGQPFEAANAAADASHLAASGDYVRADYRLVDTTSGATGLVFDLEDKPWGPNYLRVGIDLATDFGGQSAFNIKISHNRHWLTPNGTEWRNRLQIGEVPQLFSELYHPLNWTIGLSNDWFVAGWGLAERRVFSLYRADAGPEIGQLRRTTGRIGIDLGQPWGSLGELRLGLTHQAGRTEPTLLAADYGGPTDAETWNEVAVRGRVVVDQLDYANFPQSGYRAEAEAQVGRRHHGGTQSLSRLEAQLTAARSWGSHTLNVYGLVQASDARADAIVGQYALGGFQQLSGYRPGQLAGNALLFGRLNWYWRLAEPPVFARGFYVGASLEAGNAWANRHQMRLTDLRGGGSLYLGADTGIGPMFLGLTWAPEGEAGIALLIGRP
ncbi:patatin-like phospholipase family protein [Ideonella sp.]|uniref:patatin-like phospholipase family protein n=1 Tax=Ideonella sp. TaxID=1929293 RepID=UPI002B48337F|nr:patatin-like phospholipase family protein [Ideonella sp.]HJV69871.1 patatin-like phospholipase family protein [Ideonella sp.]